MWIKAKIYKLKSLYWDIMKKSRQVSSGKLKKMLQNPNSRFFTNIPPVETPIDELYEHLKKDDLKISTIMKRFSLEKNQALDWCDVLVKSNLAKIEYPFLGEPILKSKLEN